MKPGHELQIPQPMKKLSIRNQLAGKIKEIVKGPVVSEIVVKTAAGTLASVITTRSVRDLKLKKGDAVFVMIKATEASIQRA
jgi:sulfonate transport system ATP-binding protein